MEVCKVLFAVHAVQLGLALLLLLLAWVCLVFLCFGVELAKTIHTSDRSGRSLSRSCRTDQIDHDLDHLEHIRYITI